jgi:hypothetical protein
MELTPISLSAGANQDAQEEGFERSWISILSRQLSILAKAFFYYH